MTIELKHEHVGRKVKLRCGMLGVIHSYHPTSDRPFRIDLDRTKIWHYSVFYKADGKQWDIETGHDVIEILDEEEEMTIKLEVGQLVKTRGGLIGEVVANFKLSEDDEQPFKVIFNNEEDSCWYTEDGYFYLTKKHDSLDIVEILEEAKKEEEEPMETKEIKVRYFHDDNRLMFIQNVKESTITIVDIWNYEIQSVMDYGTPIKAKEQMYTYAKLFEVAEVKSH